MKKRLKPAALAIDDDPIFRKALETVLSRFGLDIKTTEDPEKFLEVAETVPAAAKLSFGVQVSQIDEIGIGFLCPHLIPKGTVLKLKTDFMAGFQNPTAEILVTVASNSFDSQKDLYSAFAEFDDASSEFLEFLRRWMTSNRS